MPINNNDNEEKLKDYLRKLSNEDIKAMTGNVEDITKIANDMEKFKPIDTLLNYEDDACFEKFIIKDRKGFKVKRPLTDGDHHIGVGISGVEMAQLKGGYPSPSHARSVRVCVGDFPPQDIQLTKLIETLNNNNNNKGNTDFPIILLDPAIGSNDTSLDWFRDVTSLCAGLTYNCPEPDSLANLINRVYEVPEEFRILDCDYEAAKFYNGITGKEQ